MSFNKINVITCLQLSELQEKLALGEKLKNRLLNTHLTESHQLE